MLFGLTPVAELKSLSQVLAARIRSEYLGIPGLKPEAPGHDHELTVLT
jgi:hypothetical protein